MRAGSGRGMLKLGVTVAATALAAASPALAHTELPTPSLPGAQDVPGADQVPDVSTVPGAPGIPGVTNSSVASPGDPAIGGSFTKPFAEGGPSCPHETQGSGSSATRNDITCKPAGVSVVALPSGKLLYWDGLEAEENVQYSVVIELGTKAVNDQSRLLSLNLDNPSGSGFSKPSPVDAGADDSANAQYLVPNAPEPLKPILNDPGNAPGALFCSDQVLLANGDVLVPGGTMYYEEPHVPDTQFGVSELQGLRSTRIYHAATNTWTQTGSMSYGRWYPSLVTLPDGKVFVASGVTKLLKPAYPTDPLASGTNVEQTETYDPTTGRWTPNGASANRALPLYPRLHLLPDGKVYYDAGGQTFNPFGQSYDEALWNVASTYDPATHAWKDLGVPYGVSPGEGDNAANTSVSLGFRGSAFSIMLPLKAPYTKASFLAAGGVLGTSPGAYFANASSLINTVDTAAGDAFSSKATGPLNNARWYSSAVLLPTGKVIAFNGANRDEVVGPGTGFAVQQAEQFDPATGKWTRMASDHNPRTYHNSAVLLPSGQILVGGNAPISTLYGYTQNLPGGFSNNFRDPSFEVYDPPYLHWGVSRPRIGDVHRALGYGERLRIPVSRPAAIKSVVLIRNTALTHLVDGDQRSVDLPVVSRGARSVTVTTPPSSKVAPAGPYLLFANAESPNGLVPSRGVQVGVS
jgi:hypothetical protein